jgi:hypothetical protein
VIDYFLYTGAQLCWIAAPLFFRCSARLVVMIHDLILVSILG